MYSLAQYRHKLFFDRIHNMKLNLLVLAKLCFYVLCSKNTNGMLKDILCMCSVCMMKDVPIYSLLNLLHIFA